MYNGKPVIGLAGGIGSGKTFVAKLFAELGCNVISSDDLVRQAYGDYKIKQAVKQWWGPLMLDSRGDVDRSAVARKIFNSPDERRRLENLLHPIVAERRELKMAAASSDPAVVAFVWDSPLLFETELNKKCDAVVWVDAPLETRCRRVAATRGWTVEELDDRENAQMPLDNKRAMSHYQVINASDEQDAGPALLEQVREVLSRVKAAVQDAQKSPGGASSDEPSDGQGPAAP